MPLHDSLVAYWTLDELAGQTRVDSHDANDLTETGTVGQAVGIQAGAAEFAEVIVGGGEVQRAAALAMLSWPIHAPGLPDGAIGAADRAHAAHGYTLVTTTVNPYLSSASSALDLGTDTSFTIVGWMNLRSKTADRTLLARFNLPPPFGYVVFYSAPLDRFALEFNNSVSAAAHVNADSLGSPSTGVWYFVAAWHDAATDTANIQINNGAVDTTAWSTGTTPGAGETYVGAYFAGGTGYMDGLIDEVGFWTRALLPEEITYLYNIGRGQTYPLDLDMGEVEDVVTVARRQLRQDLMARRLRDTIVGTTTYSPNIGVGSPVVVMDRFRATPDFSGESLYQRAYLRVGSADYRVGSFNTQSGAWISQMLAVSAFGSGAEFEVCERLSATELDDAIDETIAQQRVRMEIGSPSVAGGQFYDLDQAAFPHRILSVFDSYYFAAPTSSLNRQRREFHQHEIVNTGSGTELRVPGGLAGSQQVIVDALLQVTLGPSDLATVNLPDEETVLWGAAARCYDLLIQRSPSQEAALYEKRRREAALQFSMLSQRHLPDMSKALTLAPMDPVE